MICRYSQYGWSKKSICQRWGMSIKTFYAFKPGNLKSTNSQRVQLNTITPREKITVRDYALSHSDLRHREIAYKMIDEDIVYLSPSSVYRILRSQVVALQIYDFRLQPRNRLRPYSMTALTNTTATIIPPTKMTK